MTPLGTAELTRVGPTFDQSAETDVAAQALIKEARRLQRRRWLFGGFLAAVLLGLVLLAILISKSATPSKRAAPAEVARPSRTAGSRASDATTAYVVDAAGLVPVDLATNRAGQAIRIAGFSFSGSYSNVAMAPDGKFAYVVTSPKPPHAGHALPGPALVSINLLTRQVVGRTSFSASAVQPGQAGPAPSFYIDALAITPNGRTLLVADAADNALIPIDVRTHTVGDPIALPPEQPWDSLISSDAATSYTPSSPAPITDLTVDPDGRTAYLVDGNAVVPIGLADGRARNTYRRLRWARADGDLTERKDRIRYKPVLLGDHQLRPMREAPNSSDLGAQRAHPTRCGR